jgi:outer membrane protein assembly factor BamB
MFLYGNRPGSKGGRIIVRDPEVYHVTSPEAPNVVVFEKKTGRLVATDDTPITENLLKGQWSSISAGTVGDLRLLFYGGGDGRCYAFEPLAAVPGQMAKLKTSWSYDCNPAEYKVFGDVPTIVHYYLGNSRWGGTLNNNDGKFKGRCEIIGTPVFYKNRIYVAIGRDPVMGRGRGALQCIDATKTGDITDAGRVWTYQGLDWTCSTVSIADGLVYVGDVAGRLHCVDAETGNCHWIHDTNSKGVMGSTLVAEGKVYMPTPKALFVLAAGKEMRLLDRISVGAPIHSSPVAANGVLYIVSNKGWIWAVGN